MGASTYTRKERKVQDDGKGLGVRLRVLQVDARRRAGREVKTLTIQTKNFSHLHISLSVGFQNLHDPLGQTGEVER